ncbi:MAG: HepT-like ribonuclease domain-containing protein [Fimbriimonadales bacterium]
MRRDTVGSLTDVLQAGTKIREFVAQSATTGSNDDLYAAAVERQFVIIGEALARIRNKDPETFSRIGDGPKIIAFRNVLVHAYESVNQRLLFANSGEPLDRLMSDIDSILSLEERT